MLIAVRKGPRQGVYSEKTFKKEWYKEHLSIRKFQPEEKTEAFKWAGVKEKDLFDVKKFLAKYRACKTMNLKLKMLNKLEKKDKEAVIEAFSRKEKVDYTRATSALIERRFACIRRNKDCLDAVTARKVNIQEIRSKYVDVDLSIPVYTIKAIINAYEGNPFSEDDCKYSKNADKYYEICINYWDIIISRWDTDTGKLSKEQIKKRDFTEYHLNANKMPTIIEQLIHGKRDSFRGGFYYNEF